MKGIKRKPHKRRKNKDDILFRFEKDGSFLFEYYLDIETACIAIKVNKDIILYQDKEKYVMCNKGYYIIVSSGDI